MKVNINNAKFLLSAVNKNQYPASIMPEVALAGRSNVGKSSMINKILNRRNFAHVSSSPGKTATINFYDIDGKLMLVDLPGYGYASRSKEEIKSWGAMMDTYLNSRQQLAALILLVDSRHKPTQDDVRMLEWIRYKSDYAVVFATKCDKLKKSELDKNLSLISDTLSLKDGDLLIPFSVKDTKSAENFWEYIESFILG